MTTEDDKSKLLRSQICYLKFCPCRWPCSHGQRSVSGKYSTCFSFNDVNSKQVPIPGRLVDAPHWLYWKHLPGKILMQEGRFCHWWEIFLLQCPSARTNVCVSPKHLQMAMSLTTGHCCLATPGHWRIQMYYIFNWFK